MTTGQAARALAVGTSAGGVEALTYLAAGLPADFPAPVLVVLHVPAFSASNLPAILDRVGPLTAQHARDGEPLVAGGIYVAPPDLHLLAERGEMRLAHSAPEHNHRPAIDALFRSVAGVFGPGAIALVLTGALDDGAAGATVVAAAGGAVVVQDPNDAAYPDMPTHAISAVPSAQVAPLADIPALVDRLAREPVPGFVAA